MHYKNGRPAKVGDWVIGQTHNSERKLRVGYVKKLMPDNGACNVELIIPRFVSDDHCGGVTTQTEPRQAASFHDYAYSANLIHVLDGYRLACIAADAWNWDSEINPAEIIDAP